METNDKYTVEECINYIGLGRFQIKIMAILGFCIMADSIEIMYLAILGPALACSWPDVTQTKSTILIIVVFGSTMLGELFFGIIADKYGRRRAIFSGALSFTVFGLLTGFAPAFFWVVLLRMLAGFSLAGTTQGTTLIMEYLPIANRAMIMSIIEALASLGSIYEYLANMVFGSSTNGWRLITFISGIPILIVLFGIAFIPESPRYHIAADQQEHAEEILKEVASTNRSSLPPGQLMDVHAKEQCGSIKELFHINFRTTTFILAYMWLAVSMSYYGLILISTSLMSRFNDRTQLNEASQTNQSIPCQILTMHDSASLMFTTFGDLLGIPLLLLLIYYFERRTVFFINFAAGFMCFLLFLFIPLDQISAINSVVFLGRMFINSELNLLHLYTMEVYPTVIRAIALGSGSSMERIGMMITPLLAQLFIRVNFYGTIGIYMFATGLGALLALLLPIETKDKELNETTTFFSKFKQTTYDATEVISMSTSNSLVSNTNVNQGYEKILKEEQITN